MPKRKTKTKTKTKKRRRGPRRQDIPAQRGEAGPRGPAIFHNFLRLPQELQDHIWEIAISEKHLVRHIEAGLWSIAHASGILECPTRISLERTYWRRVSPVAAAVAVRLAKNKKKKKKESTAQYYDWITPKPIRVDEYLSGHKLTALFCNTTAVVVDVNEYLDINLYGARDRSRPSREFVHQLIRDFGGAKSIRKICFTCTPSESGMEKENFTRLSRSPPAQARWCLSRLKYHEFMIRSRYTSTRMSMSTLRREPDTEPRGVIRIPRQEATALFSVDESGNEVAYREVVVWNQKREEVAVVSDVEAAFPGVFGVGVMRTFFRHFGEIFGGTGLEEIGIVCPE